MTLFDRLLRSIFVSLAVGLGWGIRGDFGHLLGAAYPGAALGMGFAFVSGQASLFRWMPLLAAAGAIGIGAGGSMSYGILHGYAQSDTLLNYGYGFFTLFLEGGAWGGFGGVFIALLLENPRLKPSEWMSALATTVASGWAAYHVVYVLLGFDINPYRSNESIAFTGGVIGLFVWLVLHKRQYGFKGLLMGYISFGLGMSVGRLLGNLSNVSGMELNHWNVMETSCGLIGGFIYTWGMLGLKAEDPPEDEWHPLLSKLCILGVMAGIPLYHFILRTTPGKILENVSKVAAQIGVDNAELFAGKIRMGLQAVCLLAFLGAAWWLYLHIKDRTQTAAFPVLWFSGVMLLFQETNCLYFFVPTDQLTVDMHTVFWVLYGMMVLTALTLRFREVTEPDEVALESNWRKWVAGAVVAFVLVVFLAGFVNGEKTMRNANTRWPIWSWSQGPFPGR